MQTRHESDAVADADGELTNMSASKPLDFALVCQEVDVPNDLAASVGTAVMGALVVGLLAAGVMRSLTDDPIITTELSSR